MKSENDSTKPRLNMNSTLIIDHINIELGKRIRDYNAEVASLENTTKHPHFGEFNRMCLMDPISEEEECIRAFKMGKLYMDRFEHGSRKTIHIKEGVKIILSYVYSLDISSRRFIQPKSISAMQYGASPLADDMFPVMLGYAYCDGSGHPWVTRIIYGTQTGVTDLDSVRDISYTKEAIRNLVNRYVSETDASMMPHTGFISKNGNICY